MLTRGWAGGRGDGLLLVTVTGITADGLALAILCAAAGRGAGAALHPASAQHPASALAASKCLAMLTDIRRPFAAAVSSGATGKTAPGARGCFRGYRRG
jgi:hypothetical protein